MERLTTEIVLPESKSKVIVYNSLTHYESRQLAKAVMGETEISVDPTNKSVQGLDAIKMKASVNFDVEDLAVGFLMKEAYGVDGNKIDNLVEFYRNLSVVDGQFLVSEINKLTSGSQLSEEAKKK